MPQLLATAARSTTNSATLIAHINDHHVFDKPDFAKIDAGLHDHCVKKFVKLPFCCKEYDEIETTYQVFLFIFNENERHVSLELLSIQLKMPNIYGVPDDQSETLQNPYKKVSYYPVL